VKLRLKKSGKSADSVEDEESEVDLELTKYKTAQHAERRALIIVITLIVIFIIFLSSVLFFSSDEKTSHLSAYNDGWDDISKFRDHVNDQEDQNNEKLYETASILSSPTILRDIKNPEDCLYIAIGIEKEYSPDEVKAIINFVWDGGSAIIADDYGFGNSISNAILDIDESFNVGFIGKQLWDENYAKNPRFIKINVNRDESRFFEGVILLNDPTALESRKSNENWDGRNLVTSSTMGWVDINGDGKHSPEIPGEEMGKKPIVQEVTMGFGKAIFISDPSLFINDMWERENNSAFIDSMVKYLIPNTNEYNLKNNKTKLIIFDESLHIQDSVISNARQTLFQGLVILTTDTQLAILVGILMLLFLGVLIIIIENPPELRHRFNIDYYNLNQLLVTGITGKDCDRIRYIFLEHVRLSHGLSIEEFKDLSYDELEDMIKDPELVEFALDWDKKYYGQNLERILLKIRDFY
jgi:hypothetical protein